MWRVRKKGSVCWALVGRSDGGELSGEVPWLVQTSRAPAERDVVYDITSIIPVKWPTSGQHRRNLLWTRTRGSCPDTARRTRIIIMFGGSHVHRRINAFPQVLYRQNVITFTSFCETFYESSKITLYNVILCKVKFIQFERISNLLKKSYKNLKNILLHSYNVYI